MVSDTHVMATRVTSARFVGRGAELSELEAALRDAGQGRPGVVVVAGESGVGKSRLVAELSAVARREGGRVLCGDCVQVGEGELPYAPLVGALRPLAREEDPVLERLPTAVRAELARLLPALGGSEAIAPPGAGAGQGRLFEALLTLLDELACADAPLVLVIEDVHWADPSTRAFLSFLARSLDSERILALVTYRSDELHRRHPLRPLLADLERDPRVRRVELAPLTRDELAAVLADVLVPPPAPELVDRLHARSGGNPLWLEELLAAGLDGRGTLPSTLRDALMVRVERLDEDAQDVLRALAVAGRMDHELLGEVSGLGGRVLSSALRAATTAHLVTAVGEEHTFRHALLREVVEDDLLPGERAILHLAIARALERRAGGAQLAAGIAHHYTAGGDRSAALAAGVRAAAAAEQAQAFGEAAALLERALELFDQVPEAGTVAGVDRVELLAQAAEDHRREGDRGRGEVLLRAALEQVDPDDEPRRVAGLLEQLTRAHWGLGRGKLALETAQRGVELLDPAEPSCERAALLSWMTKARMLQGRYRDTLALADDALAAADAAGHEDARALTLDAVGVARILVGDLEGGTAALREAIAIARRRRRPQDAGPAYTNLADALHLAGRSHEALAVAREGLAAVGDARTGPQSWLELTEGEILFDLGDWAGATATLPPPGRRFAGNDLLHVALRRAELALGRGRHDETRALLERAEEVAVTSTQPQFLAPLGAMLAELRRRGGDLDGARAAAGEALDRIEFCTDDVMRVARLSAAGVAVEADRAQRARDLGDAEEERSACGWAEALAARVDAAAQEGGAVEEAWRRTAAAELARARGAADPRLWAAAAAGWQAVTRPYGAGLARLREAEAWLALGDRPPAEAAARAALATGRALGAAWLVGEIEGLAARARLTLDAPDATEAPAAPDDPFGLTPREHQVLLLLADGATNRRIGDELYMAEKTASVHVSRILAKLGVRTRLEAAAVAHRLGLSS